MKFDSNLAWKQASAAISANREVVVALAGVFVFLPSLALALLFPQPQPAPGLGREEMMAVVSDYYISVLPFVIPMVLFQAVGTLGLLTLLTDRSRPTVGEAIRAGLKGIIPYILAQLILGLAVGTIGGLVLAVGAATGSAAITALGLVAVFMLVIYALVKTSLVAPIIVVESEANPIAALKRSWLLTKTNSLRLALFYGLVFIAFLLAFLVVTAIVGILITLVAGRETSEFVTLVVSTAVNALMALYFVAIIAAVHRQLAGPAPEQESVTFE